jgi:hypothetical protein
MSDEPASASELREAIDELEDEREALLAERDDLAKEVSAFGSTIDARVKQRARRGIAIVLAILALVAIGGGLVFYFYVDSRTIEPARLSGRVVAAQGTAPVTLGEPCTIDVAPNDVPNAYVRVTCGGLRLYGHETFGQVWCERGSSGALRCVDEETIAADGDPQLDLDVEHASVTLSDGPAWRVMIALDGR